MKKQITVVIMAVLLVSAVIWGRPQAQALTTQDIGQKLAPAEQGVFLANYANMQLKVEEANFVESGTEVVLSYRLTNLSNEPIKQIEMLMLRADEGRNTFLAWQQKVKLGAGETKSLALTLPVADGFIPLPKELKRFAQSGKFALGALSMSTEQISLKADQVAVAQLLVKTVMGENTLLNGYYNGVLVGTVNKEGQIDLATQQALLASSLCYQGVSQFFADENSKKVVITCK